MRKATYLVGTLAGVILAFLLAVPVLAQDTSAGIGAAGTAVQPPAPNPERMERRAQRLRREACSDIREGRRDIREGKRDAREGRVERRQATRLERKANRIERGQR